ncbi:hypothetical protein GF354_06140 [Candidatus Peregrinibacteria bacterium]|nr:hypothetical protein [Candidatus Peregrinibacteria bacterium]
MNKTILTLIITILLTACNQASPTPPPENLSTYTNEDYNVAFQYPSNWELKDSQPVKKLLNHEVIEEVEKFEHAVVLKTGGNETIYFDYESLNFEEYKSYKGFDERGDTDIGGYSIENITMAGYPAKKYKEWGIELAGITYIVDKDGKFLMFIDETDLSEGEMTGVEKIIKSIEFK